MRGTATMKQRKSILCVSWIDNLAKSRELLLASKGYVVESAVGTREAIERCQNIRSDLLLLGHCIPQDEKRNIVKAYREHNSGRVISLLAPNQAKLPEVECAVDYLDPKALLETVKRVLDGAR